MDHKLERQKWDEYYSDLPLVDSDSGTDQLGAEVVNVIREILPAGGRILEAGCGGGWQSLALAKTGKYEVALLDFSSEALAYARRLFQRENQLGHFIEQSVFEEPPYETEKYDLVYNAGVLEHYTLAEQTKFLEGMALRSRRWILILIPNRLCYWYWIWRAHRSAEAKWFWGKEVPQSDLSEPFRAAGLTFHGHAFLGQTWAETFFESLPGISAELANQIRTIHRSPVIPSSEKSYLIAALGSVPGSNAETGSHWLRNLRQDENRTAEISAALADALALQLNAESNLKETAEALAVERAKNQKLEETVSQLRASLAKARAENAQLEDNILDEREQHRESLQESLADRENLRRNVMGALTDFSDRHAKELETYRSQRAWRIMLGFRRAYDLATRHGLSGKMKLLGEPFSWFSPRRRDLSEFELTFPDIWSYSPEELHVPTKGIERRAAVARNLAQRRYDLIVLPIFDFEFRFQRPQQIPAQFARDYHRVYWVSPSRFLDPESERAYELIPLRPNIWEVHLRGKASPMYEGSLSPQNEQSFIESLREMCINEGVAENAVLVQFPFWRRAALGLRKQFASKIVYDLMDDWQNWPTEPKISPANLADERELVKEADIFVVTARELFRRYENNQPAPLLVPNGTDFDFFHEAKATTELDSLRRPIIGYYGAISSWFNLEMMAAAARQRPNYEFVLIGQVHAIDPSTLSSLPNVHFLGEKHYREIPSYLRVFDVALIPFRLNTLTKAVDPVKMYEYLSQGKPVVASRMPEIEPYEDLLYLANDTAQFIESLDRAVEEKDPTIVERRIEFAKKHTWAARAEEIDHAVTAKFPLVSILVVTYNSGEFAAPFFESLARNTSYPNYEVIVVDNASTDKSQDIFRKAAAADPRIKFFASETNLGFAGGNNFAARKAAGEYLILLNPDVLVTPGWIERLLRPQRNDPKIGMTAPVTNFSGNETKINFTYRGLHSMEKFAAAIARERFGETREIEVAAMLCVLISRKLWNEIGELDERFQVGMFEDDDFAIRVRQAGYKIVTAEDCFIHHFGGGAFTTIPSEDAVKIFNRNRELFEKKWNRTWQEHRPRPGVRPVTEDRRFTVEQFFRTERDDPESEARVFRPVIRKLHPSGTKAGVPFNASANGASALAIDCDKASPGTAIKWGDTLLQTSYGGPRFLTAIVPKNLVLKPGAVPIVLVSDMGNSEPAMFTIE